jgi:hypothetical protein
MYYEVLVGLEIYLLQMRGLFQILDTLILKRRYNKCIFW